MSCGAGGVLKKYLKTDFNCSVWGKMVEWRATYVRASCANLLNKQRKRRARQRATQSTVAVFSTLCFCNNNGTSPWDRRIFITCTSWALSRRTDRLGRRLFIPCCPWYKHVKNFCFLLLPNQYKDIQPPHSIVALLQKFFILPHS